MSATPVKVVEPAQGTAGSDAAAAGGGGTASASDATAVTAGSGLNAASVLGGGFAPVPSPPPPAPPGVVVLSARDVDNTMLGYSVDTAAALEAAIAAANARNCTLPCTTITLTKDIQLGATLRVSNSMLLVGACAPEPCKLDGGGDKQVPVGGDGAFPTRCCVWRAAVQRAITLVVWGQHRRGLGRRRTQMGGLERGTSLPMPSPPTPHPGALTALQILKVTGYYGYAEVDSLAFVNGKQNSAATGVFGGAGALWAGYIGQPGTAAWPDQRALPNIV